MAQEYEKLDLKERTVKGKSKARSLRRDGMVPGVYYFRGEENVDLQIDKKKLYHAMSSGQHVFEVEMNGAKQYVTIKGIQYHPVTDEVLHIDLMQVNMTEKMKFTIPISLEGEAEGVKEGGVLSQILTTIDVNCLPTSVPDNILVDISNMELNSNMTVADIVNIPEGVEILSDPESTIATLAPPKEEEEPVVEDLEEGEELLEGEEPADGEAPSTEEGSAETKERGEQGGKQDDSSDGSD
ncbi:MAG: 50S ribosomal protein L25 [Candidatus Neomarinimicrobiota bacterium]|nr:50S ribosomal protein L25 [Candidatus Neomarinimicrobiota bacterium]